METDINRLKVVLAEKKRTNKWLCEQLGVNPSTVSKWCTNSSQPDLQTLVKIARLLEVTVDELLNNKIEYCCPEKFYHKVGCSTEPASGTQTGVVG